MTHPRRFTVRIKTPKQPRIQYDSLPTEPCTPTHCAECTFRTDCAQETPEECTCDDCDVVTEMQNMSRELDDYVYAHALLQKRAQELENENTKLSTTLDKHKELLTHRTKDNEQLRKQYDVLGTKYNELSAEYTATVNRLDGLVAHLKAEHNIHVRIQ